MTPSSNLTQTIIETIADYELSSTDELPSLADWLDEEIYEQLTAQEDQLTESLTFEYVWYDITILPNGTVVVTP